MLRRICASIITPARAEEEIYLQLTEDSPLYFSNRLTDEILILPKGYYVKVLSTSNNLSRVEYNSIVGYIDNAKTLAVPSKPNGYLYKTANLYTRSDAGTHLRQKATTSSNKTCLIPAGSTLTYLGEIKGTIPDDGTSDIWYYVLFDYGDTTTYIGYVYSERTIITNLSTAPSIETLETSSISQPTVENNPVPESAPLSSGLKIFLVILFSTLAVIIFALLLISPKQKKPKHSSDKIKTSEIPAYNHPEFASFVDFNKPRSENSPQQTNRKPQKSNNHNRNIRLTSPDLNSPSLPPSIAKYFKAEPTNQFDDEELL